ncbi:MAG: Rrf2 family transcriptional regulator [Anaerosomatales bacterium]|nr:Rrf2 family transcriptional regulator [Anaerosomatales bacterium]MDT8434314.1 Rrf2 family transcriptional regulator [Anaerosomatales bacterium]
MRVSQRLDYALRALTAIAALPPGTTMAAGEVADRLGLPRRFVEQQITLLAKQGLVVSQRGARGGCSLARPASEISVAEVVEALQGSVLDVPSVTDSAVSEMWADAARSLRDVLGETTLAGLVERQRAIDSSTIPMYHI